MTSVFRKKEGSWRARIASETKSRAWASWGICNTEQRGLEKGVSSPREGRQQEDSPTASRRKAVHRVAYLISMKKKHRAGKRGIRRRLQKSTHQGRIRSGRAQVFFRPRPRLLWGAEGSRPSPTRGRPASNLTPTGTQEEIDGDGSAGDNAGKPPRELVGGQPCALRGRGWKTDIVKGQGEQNPSCTIRLRRELSTTRGTHGEELPVHAFHVGARKVLSLPRVGRPRLSSSCFAGPAPTIGGRLSGL